MDPDPTKTTGSESDQNSRIRNRPEQPDPDPTKRPGSRSVQNNRIRVRPKHPDPDSTNTTRSGFGQNIRIRNPAKTVRRVINIYSVGLLLYYLLSWHLRKGKKNMVFVAYKVLTLDHTSEHDARVCVEIGYLIFFRLLLLLAAMAK